MSLEFRVYARRKRPEREIEHSTQLTHIHPGKGTFDLENTAPITDDSNIPIALRKGVRTCTNHPICRFVSYEGLSPSYQTFVSALDNVQVPNSIQEALKSLEWRKTFSEEIKALEKNGTWVISDLPPGKKPVACKWIFSIKHKLNPME